MKKKIILGVLSVLVVGFSINSFLNSKNVVVQNNEVQPQAANARVLNVNQSNSQNGGLSNTSVNFSLLSNYASTDSVQATIENGAQSITTQLAPYGYPNLIIQKGVPFKWVMNVSAANLNSCNNEIVINALGISKPLQVGENIIEFTPTQSGVIQYSCWMGMQTGTIAVVDNINNVDEKEVQSQIQALPPTGGCCGGR